jgi:hypothetical protein
MKDAIEKDLWDGRTTLRISTLSKRLISFVDSNYNIGSKTRTTTSLMYIGCFRMMDYVGKKEWNKFVDCNANLDLQALSLCDKIGTDKHEFYYNSMFSLHSVGYRWVDNLQRKWPIPDKKQIVYHMHNDHRLGKMLDVVTDKLGFSTKEAANLFILYALKESDALKNSPESENHLQRIDDILEYSSSIINKSISSFNNSYENMY